MPDERARGHSNHPTDEEWFDVLSGRRSPDPLNASELRAARLRSTYLRRASQADSPVEVSGNEGDTSGQSPTAPTSRWWSYAAAAAIGGLIVGFGLEIIGLQTQTEVIMLPDQTGEKSITDPDDSRLVFSVEVSVTEPLSEARKLFLLLTNDGVSCVLTYQSPRQTTLEFKQSAISQDAELALNDLGITPAAGQLEFIRIQFVRAEE